MDDLETTDSVSGISLPARLIELVEAAKAFPRSEKGARG
jgi:hypothetical protein